MKVAGCCQIHQRTKHIDTKHHFVRHHIANGDRKSVSIRTDNMIADMLTKGLGRLKFQKFIADAGLKELSDY